MRCIQASMCPCYRGCGGKSLDNRRREISARYDSKLLNRMLFSIFLFTFGPVPRENFGAEEIEKKLTLKTRRSSNERKNQNPGNKIPTPKMSPIYLRPRGEARPQFHWGEPCLVWHSGTGGIIFRR